MTPTVHPRLETAPKGEALNRIVIEPVTRVEGHGKVTSLGLASGLVAGRTSGLLASAWLGGDARRRRLAGLGGAAAAAL